METLGCVLPCFFAFHRHNLALSIAIEAIDEFVGCVRLAGDRPGECNLCRTEIKLLSRRFRCEFRIASEGSHFGMELSVSFHSSLTDCSSIPDSCFDISRHRDEGLESRRNAMNAAHSRKPWSYEYMYLSLFLAGCPCTHTQIRCVGPLLYWNEKQQSQCELV